MILSPAQVRYLICKELRDECDEPMWPAVAGIAAACIAEKYEEDYRRCEDVSAMIMTAKAAKGK